MRFARPSHSIAAVNGLRGALESRAAKSSHITRNQGRRFLEGLHAHPARDDPLDEQHGRDENEGGSDQDRMQGT